MRKTKIAKAIIAAAGYGTRFLPATKSVPKELLPVVDRPVIEYITEECVQSGIKDIIIVTRYGSSAVEDYLDSASYLESILVSKGKIDLVNKIRHTYEKANFVFVRQSSNIPYGTAAPLLSAKSLIDKDENFVFMYGDDLFLSGKPAISQVIDEFLRTESFATIGASMVPESEVCKYGVFEFEDVGDEKILKNVIEKPKEKPYPSNLVNVGRHVYNQKIFEYIEKTPLNPSDNNEFQLTTAFLLMSKDLKVTIKTIEGKWVTTGDPLNMIKANLIYAKNNPEYKDKIIEFLEELLRE